jgi:uncharacterized membrane protein YfcA
VNRAAARVTWLAIVAAFAGLLAFDLWLAISGQATISEEAWRLAARPIFPFVVGFVAGLLGGHFFWQADRIYRDK